MEVGAQLLDPAAFPSIPICYEPGWAPEPVWTRRGQKISQCLPEIKRLRQERILEAVYNRRIQH